MKKWKKPVLREIRMNAEIGGYAPEAEPDAASPKCRTSEKGVLRLIRGTGRPRPEAPADSGHDPAA